MLGRSELSTANDISCLPAVQAFASEVTRQCGFGEKDREMILLALEEAVSNVIAHAFESTEQSFQIIFEPSTKGIKIIIKDKGLPYDPDLLPGYKAPDDIEHMPPHGLGSFIMKQCVDEVSFHNLGKQGKELHLTKHLPRKSIVEYEETPPSGPVPKPPEEKTLPAPAAPMEIRLMKPSEAVEVSRLFYRTYGYSYFSDVMYYPDRLAELNREGLIHSAVAVSEGEIVGHVAMARAALSDTIAKMGQGAVNASFRGHDIFTKLEEFLIDKARTLCLKGVYGRAVTVHTFSQKMTERTGNKDCAVVLGCDPADMAFKGIAEKLLQRVTVVYSFLALAQLPVADLYPPPHHEAIIRRIYSYLGLSRSFLTSPGNVAMDDLSVMETKIIPEANTAEIVIHRYGKDCVTVLRRELRDLCTRKIDQITLFLNLADPVTSHVCREIENLGFFISGIIPCLHFEDTLMLQYLNNIIIDYSQIKLHSDMAKEILAYIRESTAAENPAT